MRQREDIKIIKRKKESISKREAEMVETERILLCVHSHCTISWGIHHVRSSAKTHTETNAEKMSERERDKDTWRKI